MLKRVLSHVVTSNRIVEEQKCWKRRRTEHESESETSTSHQLTHSNRQHKKHRSKHHRHHHRDRSHSPPAASSLGQTCLNRSRLVNYCTPFLEEQVVSVGSGKPSVERSRPSKEKRASSATADNIADDESSAVRAWNGQLQSSSSASSSKQDVSSRMMPPLERTGLETNRWDHDGFDKLDREPHRN